MHDGSLLTACPVFMTANKPPDFVAALCQATSCAQLCSGCTRDPVPTMPTLPNWRQSREQVWFREWSRVSSAACTDSAVFPGRKIGFQTPLQKINKQKKLSLFKSEIWLVANIPHFAVFQRDLVFVPD